MNTHATTQTINGVSVCSGCIQTIFGNQINSCAPGASGIASSIGLPIGSVAIDSSGNLYAANYGCNAVFKLDTAGVPSRYAGTASYTAGYTGDTGPATLATLRQPFMVKLTGSRDLYIADTGNSVIRLVDHATQIITTPMGDYTLYPYNALTYWHTGGYCCDGGSASLAGMGFPIGIYIDEVAHKWYISDLLNSRLRLAYLVSGGTTIKTNAKMSATGVKVQ